MEASAVVFFGISAFSPPARNKVLNIRSGFNPFRPMSYALNQVTSASAKPRFAGRQPSIRGGVPRVTTRPVRNGCGKRGFPLEGVLSK
jgi:hypothetical protein